MAEILDMQEACDYLKMAKPTLYNYVRAGDIPAFKMGRVWRFSRDILESWVHNRVHEDTAAMKKKKKET